MEEPWAGSGYGVPREDSPPLRQGRGSGRVTLQMGGGGYNDMPVQGRDRSLEWGQQR